MLTVIFGAGASYDSNPSRQPRRAGVVTAAEAYRPPLADELFGDRELFGDAIARFERIHPIVPRLRHAEGRTVESVMQELQAEGNDDPERQRQLAAVRYYLQYVLWECTRHWKDHAKGISNYKSLLDQIRHRRKADEVVCLATFNYDTLLEDAMPGIGLTIGGLADYVGGHPHYKVIKVHGSVNWARQIETSIAYQSENAWQAAYTHIERADQLELTNTFVRVDSFPCGRGLFPAVAIPVEVKSHFECPQEHLDFLCEHLKRTDRLLLVGWRATEAHFLDLLAAHLPGHVRALVVAGSEREAINIGRGLESRLKTGLISITCEAASGGFSDLIVKNRVEIILEP
jgi:hypothetical protein